MAPRSCEIKTETGYLLRLNHRAFKRDLSGRVPQEIVDLELLEGQLDLDDALSHESEPGPELVTAPQQINTETLRRSTRLCRVPRRLIEEWP